MSVLLWLCIPVVCCLVAYAAYTFTHRTRRPLETEQQVAQHREFLAALARPVPEAGGRPSRLRRTELLKPPAEGADRSG